MKNTSEPCVLALEGKKLKPGKRERTSVNTTSLPSKEELEGIPRCGLPWLPQAMEPKQLVVRRVGGMGHLQLPWPEFTCPVSAGKYATDMNKFSLN